MIRRVDGGYAWVILAASFMSHFLHIGFTFALLGNITVMHQKEFGISVEQSSLITSVHFGLLFIFAPVASVMVKKMPCRITELIGGVSLMLGIGLSALSKEAWHAYILFSVITAWGVACCYIASSEILARYFVKSKYLAFAVVVLGYYSGMVTWPSVSQKLFDTVGYSIAMAIMSSFHMVHIVAGVLFFEPTRDDPIELRDGCKKQHLDERPESTEIIQPESVPQTNLLKDLLSLLKNYKILLLLINCLLWNFCVGSFLTLVNDFVVTKLQISAGDAALGITILGIANIAATLVVMSTSKLQYDRTILHILSSMIFSIMTILITVVDSKTTYYVVAAIWGIGHGGLIANLLAVVYDFCGPEQMALLFGIELLSEGIGGVIGAPLSGYVRSKLGDSAGFYLAGTVGIVGSLCILPVIIVNSRTKRLKPPASPSTSSAGVTESKPLNQAHQV